MECRIFLPVSLPIYAQSSLRGQYCIQQPGSSSDCQERQTRQLSDSLLILSFQGEFLFLLPRLSRIYAETGLFRIRLPALSLLESFGAADLLQR